MTATPRPAGARCIASVLALAACAPATTADDPDRVPPLDGRDAIEAWLASGHYLGWDCAAGPHDPVAPCPHGRVRACANGIAVDQIDAAVVIEIADGAGAITGFGAHRRTRAEDTGDAWYWYMRVPLYSATLHDVDGLAAD